MDELEAAVSAYVGADSMAVIAQTYLKRLRGQRGAVRHRARAGQLRVTSVPAEG